MNSLSEIYFTTERYLFPMVEEEIGEISEKMKDFLRIVEIIRPARFLTDALRWCGFVFKFSISTFVVGKS